MSSLLHSPSLVEAAARATARLAAARHASGLWPKAKTLEELGAFAARRVAASRPPADALGDVRATMRRFAASRLAARLAALPSGRVRPGSGGDAPEILVTDASGRRHAIAFTAGAGVAARFERYAAAAPWLHAFGDVTLHVCSLGDGAFRTYRRPPVRSAVPSRARVAAVGNRNAA